MMPEARIRRTRQAYTPDDVIPRPADGPVAVFAYGTLRPSLYPAAVDRFGLQSVGRGVLYGHYEMLHLGGFPGLIDVAVKAHPDAGAAIVGEVVQVADLSQLDRYEGYPTLYTRRQVDVTLDSGAKVTSWVYLYNCNKREHDPHDPAGAKAKVVPTGDWADMIGQRH